MAIKNRHGIYDKFVPDKLVPGEFAFVRSGDPNSKDGKSIYASFDAGTTKRLATYEDMIENIVLASDDAVKYVVNEVAEELQDATDRANTSADEAETAADDATNAAEEAKQAIAGSKYPLYKSDGWPAVGEKGRLYIDDTVSPRLLYTWSDTDGYVLTGGAGGGGGDAGLVIISYTYAEYEALPESEKMRDDVIYDITDRESGVIFGNADISGIGDGTVTGAIVALASNVEILWTNPNPTSVFTGQFVNTQNLSNYKLIVVSYMAATGWQYANTMFVPCVENLNCSIITGTGAKESRTFTVGNNGVTFSDAIVSGSGVDNSLVIPYMIYGIK